MLQRPSLLGGQVHAARLCVLQSKLPIAIENGMAAPGFEPNGGTLEPLFGLEHLARSKPVVALAVLAQCNEFRCVLHCRHHRIELLLVGAVPVRKHRQVARGERRLLMGDRAQRNVRIGDDLLTV